MRQGFVPALKNVLFILLFSATFVRADGLAGSVPELSMVQIGAGRGLIPLNGAQWFALTWLTCIFGLAGLPVISRGAIRMEWLNREAPAMPITRDMLGALATPFTLIAAMTGVLPWAWLNLSGGAVFWPLGALVAGGVSVLLVQEPLGARLAREREDVAVAEGLAVAISELANLGLMTFIVVLADAATAGLSLAAFVTGQVLVARLSQARAATGKGKGEESAGGGAMECHGLAHGAVTVGLCLLMRTIFSASPVIAAELFVLLLLARMSAALGPLVAAVVTARLVRGVSPTAGPAEAELKLVRLWGGAVWTGVLVTGWSALLKAVLPQGAFSMHPGVWWALAGVLAFGLVLRLLLLELQRVVARREDPVLLRMLNVLAAALAVAGSVWASGLDPFQFLLSGASFHSEWMFVFGLLAFGWNLANRFDRGGARSEGATYHPVGLALVLAMFVVYGEMFEGDQKHFSLVNSKILLGLVAGVFVTGVLRWAEGAAQRSPGRDPAGLSLGLFVVQFSVALALPLFSVFGACAAYALLALADCGEPEAEEGVVRAGGLNQLLLGFLGIGFTIEMLRVLAPAGTESLGLLAWWSGGMAAASGHESWVRSVVGWIDGWLGFSGVKSGLALLILTAGSGVGYRLACRGGWSVSPSSGKD